MDRMTAAAALPLILLLGCSTPPIAELAPAPPPAYSIDLPLETDLPKGRVCQLGNSCMAMDSRPFEACLVGSRHCIDKMKPLVVQTPRPEVDPGAAITEIHQGD